MDLGATAVYLVEVVGSPSAMIKEYSKEVEHALNKRMVVKVVNKLRTCMGIFRDRHGCAKI